jgi:arylsulfatase A-like enzyme
MLLTAPKEDRRMVGFRRNGRNERPAAASALCLAVAIGAVLSAVGCSSPELPPKNIVLVTIDTLRADHLGAYGYPRAVSPFLDDFAASSVVFDAAFSSSSHTAPSHASLFTSLQPAQHRLLVNGEQLDDQLLTIAELLAAQGYRTAAFTPVRFLSGLAAGFETFSRSKSYEPADDVLNRAWKWIETLGQEERSFLWIHLYDVHEWRAPKRLHRSDVHWVTDNAVLQKAELRRWLRKNHGLPRDLGEQGPSILQTINRYDGQLRSVDRALQAFFEGAKTSGFSEESVWIVTSDHGEGLGNHHQMGHGKYIYDEQIRVPLLIHGPDRRFEPGRIEKTVRLVDLAPTIADLVGVQMDQQPIPVVGRSLLPLLRNRKAPWQEEEVFAQRRPADQRRIGLGWLPGEVYATRSADRKLIVNTEGECELYDLAADPFESDNICNPIDEQTRELIEILNGHYHLMQSQGEAMTSGAVPPEMIEELKALGYL